MHNIQWVFFFVVHWWVVSLWHIATIGGKIMVLIDISQLRIVECETDKANEMKAHDMFGSCVVEDEDDRSPHGQTTDSSVVILFKLLSEQAFAQFITINMKAYFF